MSLSRTDEQEDLARLAGRFFADTSSTEHLRSRIEADDGPDPQVWTRLAQELGLTGLAIPETYGGLGLGSTELGVVLEEAGRVLYPGPYFSTVALAAPALVHSDDEAARQRWLPAIAAGDLTATLAVTESGGRWLIDTNRTTAEPVHGGWVLTGRKTHVIDGASVDLLLVTARCDDGIGLFAVPADAPGLSRTPLQGLDLTRHVATIVLTTTPASRIRVDDIERWFQTCYDRAAVALAAEQLGGASRCLEAATEYARLREQFERPIGSFQAIKHKCAQMLVEIESARSACRFAASEVENPGLDASLAALTARVWSSEAFTHAAKENLQIHGGIGFTWEHDAHLYLRRAKSSELLLGSPHEGRMRLAALTQG